MLQEAIEAIQDVLDNEILSVYTERKLQQAIESINEYIEL